MLTLALIAIFLLSMRLSGYLDRATGMLEYQGLRALVMASSVTFLFYYFT